MALARLVGSFLEDSPAAFRRLILPLYGLALPQLAILVWFVAAPEFRFLSTASEAWLIVALALGLVQAGAALWAFSYSRRLSAHLNVLQRDMNDIELIAAPDGRIEYANTRAEEAYGYTAAELMSMRITDLQRGDPEVARRQMETLRVDGSLVFEALHYRRDGSSFPVEVSSRLFTTDGQTRTHSLIRDISNRRSAEAALRQSEARYRNLVANASLPLAVVSIATNRVLFANDKTIALFELDAAQLTRYQAADFWLNPDDGTRFRDTIQRDGHVAGFEMRTRGLRGTDRWLTVSANVIEFEGERATLNIFTDITATMEAKERLAEAERFARGTVDALPGSLAVLDEHGVILSVNEPWREFARSSGTQPAAMGVGLNYLQVCDASSTLGEPDGRRFGDGLRAVMSGQLDTFSMKYECTAPATDRWMMARVTRFPGAGRAAGRRRRATLPAVECAGLPRPLAARAGSGEAPVRRPLPRLHRVRACRMLEARCRDLRADLPQRRFQPAGCSLHR